MSTSSETNFLDMPDDDVMQMSAPPAAPAAVDPPPAGDGVVPGSAPGEAPPAVPADPPVAGAPDPLGADDGGLTPPVATPPVVGEPPAVPAATDPAAAGGAGEVADGDKGGDKPPVVAPVPPSSDIAVELARRMADGIKANGKVLKIQSADEAERLMQMGAGFTKRMQELAPAMRIVKMLSNNGLLDEARIAYLIDLDQKNPDAIQKLLADSEFDPLSVDKAKADGYRPGDHRVTDNEVQFQQRLDAMVETEDGTKFLLEIQGQWDGQSKQALLKEPEILDALTQQRSNGIYQLITDEIDRLTVLGQIPANTPFLQAYRAVGDMLNQAGKLVVAGTGTETPPPAIVTPPATATPPAAKTPPAAALEAAPVRATTTKPAAQTPDFLNMPDSEFMGLKV